MTFFCQIWSQDSLRHLLGPPEVHFDICQFLATPGLFEYFGQKQGSSESQCFLDEGATGRQSVLGFVGGQVPRLYGGTIFGGMRHPGDVWRGFESEGSASENLCRIFLTPQMWGF